MKKISLKDVKNGLKRDEMRTILGGRPSPNDYYCSCAGGISSGPIRSGCTCEEFCAGGPCNFG